MMACHGAAAACMLDTPAIEGACGVQFPAATRRGQSLWQGRGTLTPAAAVRETLECTAHASQICIVSYLLKRTTGAAWSLCLW